jgi:hypothetical protein
MSVLLQFPLEEKRLAGDLVGAHRRSSRRNSAQPRGGPCQSRKAWRAVFDSTALPSVPILPFGLVSSPEYRCCWRTVRAAMPTAFFWNG